MKTTMIAAALVTLVACAGNFEPAYRVSSPRILAVQADAPYAAPGQRVTLTALGHDPEGRALEWAFATCVNPPASTPTACIAKAMMDRAPVAVGPSTTFSFTVPSDAISALPAEARATATVGVMTVACPGKISLAGAEVRCTDATGRALSLEEFDMGMKRVFVRTDKNENPSIAGVTWDGQPWPETETKEVTACQSDTNKYADCDADKHRIAISIGAVEAGEDVVAQYYATDGIFESPARIGTRTETGYVARRSGEATLWMIARDNRGGVGWTSRRVKVR